MCNSIEHIVLCRPRPTASLPRHIPIRLCQSSTQTPSESIDSDPVPPVESADPTTTLKRARSYLRRTKRQTVDIDINAVFAKIRQDTEPVSIVLSDAEYLQEL